MIWKQSVPVIVYLCEPCSLMCLNIKLNFHPVVKQQIYEISSQQDAFHFDPNFNYIYHYKNSVAKDKVNITSDNVNTRRVLLFYVIMFYKDVKSERSEKKI